MAEETWTRDPDWVYIPGEDRPVRVEDILPEEPTPKKKPLKLGGEGMPRVYPHRPKPPAVADHYKHWGDAPPELSERCQWWLEMIERGWRPNRRIRAECYDCSAEWYGIYIWEFIEKICPALQNGRLGDYDRADAIRKEELRLRTPLGPQTAKEWFASELKKGLLEMMEEEFMNQILYGNGQGAPSGIDRQVGGSSDHGV